MYCRQLTVKIGNVEARNQFNKCVQATSLRPMFSASSDNVPLKSATLPRTSCTGGQNSNTSLAHFD